MENTDIIKNVSDARKLKCVLCGKEIVVNKHTDPYRCKCDSCRNIRPSNKRTCKICGEVYYKNECGCGNPFCRIHSIHQFTNLIKYFGFDKTKLGTKYVEEEFYRIRDIIYNLYWVDNLSTVDIAEKYHFPSKHCISQTVFKILDIPRKSFKESSTNAYLSGKIPSTFTCKQYKYGWHTTWDGKSVFLRSSYELDYAIKLDESHILYEVESLKIPYFDSKRNQKRVAIPDFYIPQTNTIVEIKSNYTLDIQEMKDKCAEYERLGYKFKLILEHKESNINDVNVYENNKYDIKDKEFSIYKVLGSSYGTCWVYNDMKSIKIKKNDLQKYIDNGWTKGRKMKF